MIFIYELGQEVEIRCSGEHGEITGRAEYANAEPSYLIRYKQATGQALESWWTTSAIRPRMPGRVAGE